MFFNSERLTEGSRTECLVMIDREEEEKVKGRRRNDGS